MSKPTTLTLHERFDAALNRYTQIIQLDPNNAWAAISIAAMSIKQWNQPEKAKADFDKAREIDPSIDRVE